MAGTKTPGSKGSRYAATGAQVILPTRNLAGKARAKRPGSDLDRGDTISNTLKRFNLSAISNISSRTDVNEIIRLLCRENGMFSSAANSMAAISVGTGFRLAVSRTHP